MDKKKIFEVLGEDFKKVVEQYRMARHEEEKTEEYDFYEKYNEELKNRNSIYTSKNTVKITRVDYWRDIVRSKIEIIGAIGGFEMMQEFSQYLSEIDNQGLMLESAFCYLADGICGWCA